MSDIECPICLESPGKGAVVVRTECCDQPIHESCSEKWAAKSRCCPMCRARAPGTETTPLVVMIGVPTPTGGEIAATRACYAMAVVSVIGFGIYVVAASHL